MLEVPALTALCVSWAGVSSRAQGRGAGGQHGHPSAPGAFPGAWQGCLPWEGVCELLCRWVGALDVLGSSGALCVCQGVGACTWAQHVLQELQ